MARISVNKLGEYLVAPSPARRRKIVYDQKHRNGAIVPRYRNANEPLTEYFEGGARDQSIIDRAVVKLRTGVGRTAWANDDRRNTADALELIAGLASKLPFDGVTYRRGPEQAPHLSIKSVAVSVRPHFLLTFQHRGVQCVGALKVHFPKGEDSTLEQKGGEYVAVLLHQWLLKHGPSGCKPMPSHCFSVDVFRKAIVAAPTSMTRRMNDVTAACDEIAASWATL